MLSNSVIFCDFDGTITQDDCTDKLLNVYADPIWENIEGLWNDNIIGSEECLRQQLACIYQISVNELIKFAYDIKIDPTFIPFINYIQIQGNPFYIVSDGFDIFINSVLRKNNLTCISSFSNKLKFENGKLVPYFPYTSNTCISKSGVCKCDVIKENRADKFVIYIGDGRSDMCAARNADLVFAKGKLAKYCSDNAINYVEFSSFKDILTHFLMEANEYVICGASAI